MGILPLVIQLRFEVADRLRQVFSRGNEVDVVLQDDVTQECQAVLVLQELPGIEQDLDRLGPRKYRQSTATVHVKKWGKAIHRNGSECVPSLEPRALRSTRSVADGIPTQSIGTRMQSVETGRASL